MNTVKKSELKPIFLDYTTLKNSTNRVLCFAEEFVEMKGLNLRTSIEEDLSLWELDGYLFLNEFQEKFEITIPDEVYDYVGPPNLKMNFFLKIIYPFIFILTLPFFLLLFPFVKSIRKESVQKKIKRNKYRLTLGDLAASLALGRFVKREEVRIRLIENEG